MNAAISQKSPARLAELDPFILSETVPRVLQPGEAAQPRGPRNAGTFTDAEYGCVDWYHYRDPADEENTRHWNTTCRSVENG